MYKLFIADDESTIREGIKCLLDWNILGYEIAGEAANGRQAYQMILDINPDLVLLDIRMPGLSGLEVIESLRADGFHGKVIILSGYSDFSYAQQAISHGVLHYLTKPIDKVELKKIVTTIKSQLDADKAALDTNINYRQKAYPSIIEEILKGNSDLSKIELDKLHLEKELFQVVIYEKYSHEINDLSYRFSDLLRVTNQNNNSFDAITNGSHEIILLKGSFSLQKFQEFLEHYNSEQLPQKNSPLDSIFLAYGRTVSCLSDIPLSYEDAMKLISRRFFCEQGQHFIGFESLPKLDSCMPVISNKFLQECTVRLYESLCTFRPHKTAEILQELQVQLYTASDSIDSIKLFFADLFLQLKERLNRIYTNTTIPFPSNTDIIRQISEKHYLYEIVLFLTEQFKLIIASTGGSSNNSVLDDVLYYIKHNYSQNITLENIAPLFGYNSSYLGKIFTKKVGESFNSYLESIRIEHAMELLLQDELKVYAIAELVGYRNIDYFYMKFKKYVGMTPAEFRRQHKEKGQ